MTRRPPPPPPRGQVTIVRASDDGASVRVELGYPYGAVTLNLGPVSGGTRDEVLLHLRWRDRPGDPVSVSDDLLVDKDYLAHAKLDLRSGEVFPGWMVE